VSPYYQDDWVTIYHADCLELLPSLDADVLVTDPPYGVNLGNHYRAARNGSTYRGLQKAAYASYEDTVENFEQVVVPAIWIALDHTQRGMVFCAGHMMWKLPTPDAVGGVFLPAATGRTVWGFNSFAHALLYGKTPHAGSRPTGIQSTARADGLGHPTEKPLVWMRWAISLVSRLGETVVDPFAGGGTTLRAAKDLGRKAIGIEIEERYCEIAARRCAQDVLDLDVA
jgi:site-specific DNA-methyltransferase (adenine-specific)